MKFTLSSLAVSMHTKRRDLEHNGRTVGRTASNLITRTLTPFSLEIATHTLSSESEHMRLGGGRTGGEYAWTLTLFAQAITRSTPHHQSQHIFRRGACRHGRNSCLRSNFLGELQSRPRSTPHGVSQSPSAICSFSISCLTQSSFVQDVFPLSRALHGLCPIQMYDVM